MICPKCGEVNSSNFLFCGMCGTMLEPARKATAPKASPIPQPPAPETRIAEERVASTPPVSTVQAPVAASQQTTSATAVSERVPPIGGPSLLGLDSPNVDVLRERAFTSLDSYGETDSKSKGSKLLLLLLLLAALGAGYWWTYTNYLKVTDARKATPTPAVSSSPEETASVPAGSSGSAGDGDNLPLRSAPRVQPPIVTPEPPGKKTAAKVEAAAGETSAPPAHQVNAARLPATPAPAADNGDTLFRQGERYLYGRGGAEDCTSALKFLKMASDKQNAKARSAIGTMYATGHCVSRDLPNAYRWFALSLRVDPNNSVVEKNLSAVWNQMTPPERQLATRSGGQ